jgi:hypothetical protein
MKRNNSPLKNSITSPAPAVNTEEKEKEKRLAEERAQAALKLQRKQRLEALIIKRKGNLQYLKVFLSSMILKLISPNQYISTLESTRGKFLLAELNSLHERRSSEICSIFRPQATNRILFPVRTEYCQNFTAPRGHINRSSLLPTDGRMGIL